MKAKWYFSTLLIILAVLGVCQQQLPIHNQQIVLQFVDQEITQENAKQTLATVKEQLLSLGVKEIEVSKESNGTLKISYYSTADVSSIKNMLSGANQVHLDYASYTTDEQSTIPSEEKQNSYNVDVYKLQNGADEDAALDGKYVIELKQEYDRSTNPNPIGFVYKVDESDKDYNIAVAYRVRKNVVTAIQNPSYIIPDVRAGPSLI